MKYRALWSQRPLSAIEEEEGEEGGDEERPPSRGRCDSSCRVLTPYGSQMRPPGTLCTRGYAVSPDGSSALSNSLNKIIDTATINVIGFEESFAAHLSDEACSLMWNLCQVYGKTRMAIDLVERELIASKQEMKVAKHVFEDLSVTENALCDGIIQKRSLREIAEIRVLKLRQEYRKALDENTIIKLKANRYQLHLDKMENACSELFHQNYSVKAFMAICREKEKKQTTRPAKPSRYPVKHVATDILVNGRYCNTPRRHCPKVDLSLPKPGQMQSEPALHRFPPGYRRSIMYYDKKIMQRITTAVSWTPNQDTTNEEAEPSDSLTSLADNHAHLPHFTGSAAVTPDIPNHLPSQIKKVVKMELTESAKSPASSTQSDSHQQAIDDVGFIVIPEFEVDDDLEDPESVPCGQTAEQSGGVQQDQGDRISSHEIQATNHQEGKKTSRIDPGSMQGRQDDAATVEGIEKQEDLDEEPAPASSESTDDISVTLRETVSSYLSGTGGVKDVESIANTIQKQAHSDTTLQNKAGGAPQIAQPGRPGSHLTPFIMARGVGLQREVSEHHSSIPCSYPCTTYRCHKLMKIRDPITQRPATCAAVYHESSTSGRTNGSNGHTKKRAVSVMNDNQAILPPIPSQHSRKQTGSMGKTRESRSILVKDKKAVSSLPSLEKSEKHVSRSPRVRSSESKLTSEKLHAQVRSVTRQVLPALPSSETPHTKFHQVLLIRSCSSEKLERPSLPSLHSGRCRAPDMRNSSHKVF